MRDMQGQATISASRTVKRIYSPLCSTIIQSACLSVDIGGAIQKSTNNESRVSGQTAHLDTGTLHSMQPVFFCIFLWGGGSFFLQCPIWSRFFNCVCFVKLPGLFPQGWRSCTAPPHSAPHCAPGHWHYLLPSSHPRLYDQALAPPRNQVLGWCLRNTRSWTSRTLTCLLPRWLL